MKINTMITKINTIFNKIFDQYNINKDIVYTVTTKTFKKNESANKDDFKPGDFILVHGEGFFEWAIRCGQAIRFWGKDRVYTYWHHAALIIDENGNIIEAKGGKNKVLRSKLSDYDAKHYKIVNIDSCCNNNDRQQIVEFGKWCEGQKYGYFTIISILISMVFGLKFTFMYEGQAICSGLVARALERTSLIFNASPSHITPADLAKVFDIRP